MKKLRAEFTKLTVEAHKLEKKIEEDWKIVSQNNLLVHVYQFIYVYTCFTV